MKKIRLTLYGAITSGLVACSLVACSMVARQEVIAEFARYHCGDDILFDVVYDKGFEQATLSDSKQSWRLTRARSASGMLFASRDSQTQLHLKGDDALIDLNGLVYRGCTRWKEDAKF